jgi:hypothetical protein
MNAKSSCGIPALLLMLAVAVAAMLGGCGSTKVYTVQKSVVYKGALYNVSNVKVMSASIEARLQDGSVLDLANVDKKGFNQYVATHGAMPVRMVISMDGQELLYLAGTIDKFSNFDSGRKNFANAQKSIQKFMADKKKTQLKLK